MEDVLHNLDPSILSLLHINAFIVNNPADNYMFKINNRNTRTRC